MTTHNGFYLVNGERIDSKVYAMLRASELNANMEWCYFDDIFAEQSWKFRELDISLEEMYARRARQLRETYDYLILNYSGGSDSHNILEVFLRNNIRLDHIVIQWPEKLMDKGLYTPNTADKSNANFHSEWDLVIKKDLERLANSHPEIKIEILDWTSTVKEDFYSDDLFLKNVSNLPSIARAQKQNTFSNTESELALKGKRVASIYGVDKPILVIKDSNFFFSFADTACMAQSNPDNPLGVEYFYYAPMMPELAVLQSYKLAQWFNANPNKQYLITAKSERAERDPTYPSWPRAKHFAEWEEVQEIIKLVCYPYWDFSRFQADKPFKILNGLPMGMRLWDNILTAIPGFERVQQKWEYNWKSYLNKIDSKFMRNHDTVAVFHSKWHKLKHIKAT